MARQLKAPENTVFSGAFAIWEYLALYYSSVKSVSFMPLFYTYSFTISTTFRQMLVEFRRLLQFHHFTQLYYVKHYILFTNQM